MISANQPQNTCGSVNKIYSGGQTNKINHWEQSNIDNKGSNPRFRIQKIKLNL